MRPAAMAGLAITTGALALAAARLRRHMALTEQHRLHFALRCEAMGDETLAADPDIYDGEAPSAGRRQFLFAHALHFHALQACRIGVMSPGELHGHRQAMCQNPILREYWEITHHHASLCPSSEEAEMERALDSLVQGFRAANTGERWIVEHPPAD
nr:DUF6082 family protein [Streptomyces sp. YIM 121038]